MHAINVSFFSTLCTPYYDNQYTFTVTSGAVATNTAILHPNIYYIGDSWSSTNSPEFWNKGNVDATVNNNPIKKTIYSPSPSESVEPKAAVFSSLTTTGVYNKGWNFYCQSQFAGGTIFFSALGLREYNSGAADYITSAGLYWSASPSGANSAHEFRFLSYIASLYIDYKSYGFNMRSVYE